jgi:hypothetical protein
MTVHAVRPALSAVRPERTYNRRWTARDHRRLAAYWGILPDREVARRLDRTVVACLIRAKRHLGISRGQQHTTARAVARLFGVDESTARRWITRGWLTGHRSPIGAGGRFRQWSVPASALLAFVREHPLRYEFDRLAAHAGPEHWLTRAAAEAQRADPWLDVEPAAALLGYTVERLRDLAWLGRLPSAHRSVLGRRAHPWQGRLVFRRSALEAFRRDRAAAEHERRAAAARRRALRDGLPNGRPVRRLRGPIDASPSQKASAWDVEAAG